MVGSVPLHMDDPVGTDYAASKENVNEGKDDRVSADLCAPRICWILSGIPFDIIHGISNFAVGFLILPLVNLLTKLNQQLHRSRKTT